MATYRVKAKGAEYTVHVEDRPSGGARIEVEGESFDVELLSVDGDAAAAPAVVVPILDAGPLASSSAAAAPPAPTGSGSIVAPIPGLIVSIVVKVGDSVAANQLVLKLEAMKMENDIVTPVAGTVREIAVNEGSNVGDGELLMVIE